MSNPTTAPAAITVDAAVHAANPAACLNYGNVDHTGCPSSVECHHAHVPAVPTGSNNATPALTTFDAAAATFDGIRPAAVKYGDAVRAAERAESGLAGHADINKVWQRMDYLIEQNMLKGAKNPARGVSLDVAREILNTPGLTLTREEGKDLTPAQKRLEALKKWLDRNRPDAEKKARPVRMAVTMSGDDAPVTGTVVIHPETHPDVYAALLDILAAAADSGE